MPLLPLILITACHSLDPSADSAATQDPGLWMPAIYGDGMVLQREAPLRFHGDAPAGIEVRVDVAIGEHHRAGAATCGEDGGWKLELEPLPAAGPGTVTVTAGSESRTFGEVWVGEVWICSGQSNMEWSMRAGIVDTAGFRAAADQPELRLYHVPRSSVPDPQRDAVASWTACNPETVLNFSAVGYFFGKEIQPHVDCKVGLIESAWGGSAAEAWVAKEHLEADESLAPLLGNVESASPNHKSSHLFNGMIHPLLGYGIRGAIWYQGESNAGRAEEYRKLFPTMIQSWRERFGQGDFPFLWVQLAAFKAWNPEPVDSTWAMLREAQTMTLSLPNTGEAVIIDLGETRDIHPRNKHEVGRRLGLNARRVAYGQDLVHTGPRFKSMELVEGALRLQFDFVAGGLLVLGGGELLGFQVAGEDRVWHWADARLDQNQVVLTCEAVPIPVAVRYGWADNPGCNLGNKESLPASPFRTDDW